MSSPIKLSLLALISTAAAVPHNGHSRFHKPSGGYGGPGTGNPVYATGAWPGSNNNTAAPHPTGTGVVPDDKTTTLLSTLYSTETLVSTIYATKPSEGGYGGGAPSSVGAVDVSTGAGACGPETVYVTATNKVTVTVPAGGAPPSSVAEPMSSASPSSHGPSGGHESSVSFEFPSSTQAPVPESTTKGGYSILPIPSETAVEAPKESAVETPKESPVETPKESAVETPKESPVETPKETPVETPVQTPVPTEAEVSSAAPESSSPAPSATPKPSPPTYSGGKRGLAYNDAKLCSAFAGTASWAWNWASVEGGELPEGVKFVPIAWGPSKITKEQWLKDVEKAVSGGSDTVMGFNEPDHGTQSNMAPGAACSAWKEYMEPVASAHPDVTILGPSVTNGGPESMNGDQHMGLTWLQQFQDACPEASWHAANIHFYDIWQEGEGMSSTLYRFEKHIKDAAAQTGKPIFLTEFGLNAGSAPADAAKFLKGAMEIMEKSDAVKGYSYFMVGTGENQLNTLSGLSGTGEVYAA